MPTLAPTLWCTLDSAAAVLTPQAGPGGRFSAGGFVAGVLGGAWQADSTALNGITFPSVVLNGKSGTVEFWARLEGYSGTLPTNGAPGFLHTDRSPGAVSPDPAWYMGFAGNDGGGNGGLTAGAGDANTTGTNRFFGGHTYESILGEVEDWHHYSFVWNAGGLDAFGVPDEKVVLLIDGEVVSTSWHDRVLYGFDGGGPVYGTGRLLPPVGETLFLLPGGISGGKRVTLDEFTIWQNALHVRPGTAGDDAIEGGEALDRLVGLAGDDTLHGRAGKDVLEGGAGSDRLHGGGGSDVFVLSGAPVAGEVDRLRDFAPGHDVVWLALAAFDPDDALGLLPGGLDAQPGRFVAQDNRHATMPGVAQFIYDTTTGRLFFDADGKGGAEGLPVAVFSGAPAVAGSDLILV
jgi:Ca2+-binding RTX toxin-like protein